MYTQGDFIFILIFYFHINTTCMGDSSTSCRLGVQEGDTLNDR